MPTKANRHVSENAISVPEWDGVPREAAEVWRLRKGARVAACALWTHPLGAELRVSVDGETHRTEATRVGHSLLDLADEWKAQFQRKGWTT
jgi:hypothetical protein